MSSVGGLIGGLLGALEAVGPSVLTLFIGSGLANQAKRGTHLVFGVLGALPIFTILGFIFGIGVGIGLFAAFGLIVAVFAGVRGGIEAEASWKK